MHWLKVCLLNCKLIFFSICDFSQDCDMAMHLVDQLLNLLTHQQHSRTKNVIEERRRMQEEEERISSLLCPSGWVLPSTVTLVWEFWCMKVHLKFVRSFFNSSICSVAVYRMTLTSVFLCEYVGWRFKVLCSLLFMFSFHCTDFIMQHIRIFHTSIGYAATYPVAEKGMSKATLI